MSHVTIVLYHRDCMVGKTKTTERRCLSPNIYCVTHSCLPAYRVTYLRRKA